MTSQDLELQRIVTESETLLASMLPGSGMPIRGTNSSGLFTVTVSPDGIVEELSIHPDAAHLPAADVSIGVIEAINSALNELLHTRIYSGETSPTSQETTPLSTMNSISGRVTSDLISALQMSSDPEEDLLSFLKRANQMVSELKSSHLTTSDNLHEFITPSRNARATTDGGGRVQELTLRDAWVRTCHPDLIAREALSAIAGAQEIARADLETQREQIISSLHNLNRHNIQDQRGA